MIPKLVFRSAALAILLLTGCAKDINNKEAVRTAVVDYLTKRSEATGLNMANMNIQVASVSFQQDQAQATVSITPNGASDGMQMSYALVRKGDKWEVKGQQSSGGASHGGGAPAGMALPPNHPPAAGDGKAK